MSVDLRMPNITGATEREQLAQIRSYLYQFIPQLQWALNTMETSSSQGQTVQQIIKEKASSNTPVSAEATFNDIKSLIIKSADIVEAYYEEINSRLYSEYQALSDFGAYTEQTEKLVRETASFTTEMYEKIATIDENMDGIPEYIRKTKGYIQTGFIVQSLSAEEAAKYGKKEGEALIGVEVGDSTDGEFRKYARFTANRLSFYDQNDTEVAYVSSYKLYIRDVEIKRFYTIGGYQDEVKGGGEVITKWIGVDG